MSMRTLYEGFWYSGSELVSSFKEKNEMCLFTGQNAKHAGAKIVKTGNFLSAKDYFLHDENKRLCFQTCADCFYGIIKIETQYSNVYGFILSKSECGNFFAMAIK